MSEASMAWRMGTVGNSVGLIVRRSTDPKYHELDRDLKRRVKRGDGVVFNEAGNMTGVIDREELRRHSQAEVKVAGVEEVPLRAMDAIGRNPIAAKLAAGLNGDEQRARKLFRNKAGELDKVGSISQAEIIRHIDSSQPPVYGVQTGELDTSKRLKAYFSREGETFVLRVICRAGDDERGRSALRMDGYVPQKMGRGARRG